MKLAGITDTDRLALLALARLRAGDDSDDDVLLCDSRGWVAIDYSEISDRLAWSSTGCDSTGDWVLQEARTLADGLTVRGWRHLDIASDDSSTRHTVDDDVAGWLAGRGLVAWGRPDGRFTMKIRPAGRLILDLRKLSK